MAMSSHETPVPKTMNWLTPPYVIEALGQFDLDPCASEGSPFKTARRHYTQAGLTRKWTGAVWLNPPYGREIGAWIARLAAHGDGVALIFARTDTAFWHRDIWPKFSGLLFFSGRLHFHRPDGSRAPANAGAPSVLVAYGEANVERLEASGLDGHIVYPAAGRRR